MPDYPRPCPKCGQVLERDGFAVDRHAVAGRKSHCKECDRRRQRAYYDDHKDEWNAQRKAQREAAYEADLEQRIAEKRPRIEAEIKRHAAQVRAQADYLRSIGVL
jgi:hypothetical protein